MVVGLSSPRKRGLEKYVHHQYYTRRSQNNVGTVFHKRGRGDLHLIYKTLIVANTPPPPYTLIHQEKSKRGAYCVDLKDRVVVVVCYILL